MVATSLLGSILPDNSDLKDKQNEISVSILF